MLPEFSRPLPGVFFTPRVIFSKIAMLLACILFTQNVHAEIIDELLRYQSASSSNYRPADNFKTAVNLFPGQIVGNPPQAGEESFTFAWQHRRNTYEIHFEHAEQLARSIYSLALDAGDISQGTPRDKFYRGVSGFHYSVEQICAFASKIESDRLSLTDEESFFINELIRNKVIIKNTSGFAPTGEIEHIIGAAPGKKRTFAQNLRHERLHVYWDVDDSFRELWQKNWACLDMQNQEAILASLKNYNQENLPQIIEEWAIGEAEKQDLPTTRY